MKKINLTTIFLLFITVFLIGVIIYISQVLTVKEEEVGTGTGSTIAPKKIKASNITYTKLIALNRISPTPIISEAENSISPTRSLIASNQLITGGQENNLSSTITQASSETPTPTEIILAYNSTSNDNASEEATTRPTEKITSIPASGVINNSLIIFSAALLLVFFSFLF